MERPGQAEENPAMERQLSKHLLLLAMLVVSVTYAAGLNPPGGVWQENGSGHKAGDNILAATRRRRYLGFYYLNGAALAASVVIVLLLLLKKPRRGLELALLRAVMAIYMVGLVVAYFIGSFREFEGVDTPASLVVIIPLSFVLTNLAAMIVFYVFPYFRSRAPAQGQGGAEEEFSHSPLKRKERRKVLMLLAAFMTAITYVTGVSWSGGYKTVPSNKNPDDVVPSLKMYKKRLFRVFFGFNVMAFSASLLVVLLLINKNKRLCRIISLGMTIYTLGLGVPICLSVAYASGTYQKADTSLYVLLFIAVFLAAYIFLLRSHRQSSSSDADSGGEQVVAAATGTAVIQLMSSSTNTRVDASRKVNSLILLLATLVGTVTYQAGLDPPGGVWPDGGHSAGDPILLSTHPVRYKVFFYCNSISLVLSFAIMVRYAKANKSPTTLLESLMLGLDIAALMGAYTMGGFWPRDVRSVVIYLVVMALGVMVYVSTHLMCCITVYSRTTTGMGYYKRLKKRHRRLLLVAILIVTITYQAGLNPPGGFRRDDRAAGREVLLDSYPLRLGAFFYCNTASFFLATMALVFLLVSPNQLYWHTIKCYALYACIVLALLGVMAAYAAGSARNNVQASAYFVYALIAVVVAVIVIRTIRFRSFLLDKDEEEEEEGSSSVAAPEPRPRPRPSRPRARPGHRLRDAQETEYRQVYARSKYLMLFAALGASVTYHAGLAPPGGVWQDDGDHGDAGTPVLYERNRGLYRAFFYSNSTSFMASVFLIALQILWIYQGPPKKSKLLELATNTALVLVLLGLVAAYAAGAFRDRENGIALVVMVLLCIVIHVAAWILTCGKFAGMTERIRGFC